MTESNTARNGALFILFASLIWGTSGTAQTFLPLSVSSLSLGAVRLVISSVSLVTLVLLQGGFKLTPAWSWKTALFAGPFLAISQLSYLSAIRITGVAVGTIVGMGSVPIFSAVLDYILQKERFSRNWYIATLLSLSGTLVLALSSGSELQSNTHGILLTLLAGFSYSVSTLASKRLLKTHPPATVLAVNTTMAALLASPFLFTSSLSWLGTTTGLLVALHLGLVVTSLGHISFAYGLRSISVHNAATLTLAEPLTATLLGILLVGEPFSGFTLGGMALIFSGLLLLTVFSPRR